MESEYLAEDTLIEKLESGEYSWLDYVNHFSEDWREEYREYCQEHGLPSGNASAMEFVHFKDEQLEKAMAIGDA